MADVNVLDVLLYDEPVGTLTRVGGDRTLFAFNDDYSANDNRPVLGLAFKDQLGELITAFRPTQTRVIPFFSNLLPEGHLRTYLAERAGVNPVREFFLLWVLGRDLPGAITIRPADGEAWSPDDQRTANDDRDDDHRRRCSALFIGRRAAQILGHHRGCRWAHHPGRRRWRLVDREAALAADLRACPRTNSR